MKRIQRGCGLFLLLVLTGCATPPVRLSTPSGRPEVTIRNVSSKQVVDYIAEKMLAGGMDVRNVSDYGLTAGKKIANSFAASLVYGSEYDATPEARFKFNAIQEGKNVRLFARDSMVTNPGSGFERVHDQTTRHAQKLEGILEQVKAHFENIAAGGK